MTLIGKGRRHHSWPSYPARSATTAQWVSKRRLNLLPNLNIARLPDIISATFEFGVDRTPTHTHATSTPPPDWNRLNWAI